MSVQAAGTAAPIPTRDEKANVAAALKLLIDSLAKAKSLARASTGKWSPAKLQDAGVSAADLEWLLRAGYLEAIAPPARPNRGRPRRMGWYYGTQRLEGLRARVAEWVLQPVPDEPALQQHVNGHAQAPLIKPHWDAEARELYVENLLVKQLKLPARNQEHVLAAFEEAGWPRRLADPFPVLGEVEPGQRLHDLVRRLNEAQQNRLLRFERDGTGHGLRWCLVQPSAEFACRTARLGESGYGDRGT